MENLVNMYLDYVNKFITIARFAERYWLDEDDAKIIINMWMKYNDRVLYKDVNK